MTKNQLYTFRNEQALPIKPCDCASQDIVFDLNKYGPYFDKIRALFVPSLEYRFQSLLKEFVYNTNSRWAKQFPCFKKFIDMIIMWKDPLNKIAEYDISTMEEIMKNTIKRMIKDDLITCFLDSVILYHRLKKVCRELDTLGIEDNILKNFNLWNFVNEQDYLDRNYFMNFNTTISMDCNMNLNTVPCNTKRSIKCKKTVKSLAKNIYDRSTEHIQQTTSKYRKHQILDLNQNFLHQKEDNSYYYSTCVATGSRQNDYSTDKINKSFNEKSCNTESKKIRNDLKLKIIIHKVQIEDHEYSTFSSANVTRLSLPCKPSNLIRRIFEADPSLTESCLIVMKRKFEDSMHNVCSCLNSVIEKLNIELTKTLCLNCEIYSGYISFKLKAPNIKKHFFVTRVPICQNVHKCMVQEDFSILSSKSSTEINELKCFSQCKDNGTNFNDAHVDAHEKAEKLDTCYSQSDEADRSFIKNIVQNKTENNNENSSRYVENLVNFSCNDPCKDNVEEIYNMTSCVDNSVERNREDCAILNSMDINYDDDVKKCGKNILESSNLIIRNDMSTQLVNNANCTCLSYENFTETNNEIEDIFSNKDLDNLDNFSQTSNEYDCLSNKKSNLENEICTNTNRCSITSFIQNSEYDKQLVELNYNCFSNNINKIDKHFDTRENDSLLNSAKVEIGSNSCCSCRCDDFIDITVTDNILRKNNCAFETSQNNFDAVTARSTDYSKTVQVSSRSNNLLTISIPIQMPKSKILSKEINIDTCYPRTVWLTCENDKNIKETSDGCNEIANLSTHTLIVSKKRNQIFPDINKEMLDVKDGTQDFVTSPERFSMSKGRFRSNGDSRSSVSTREYLRSKNHSISNASLYCRSFVTTSEFAMSDRQDKFQKSMLRGRRLANGIHNDNISTIIKHRTASRRHPNNYSEEIRPQMILAITKFRNSIDKSINRIKRLIREKLRKILFNNKISNNNNKMTKTFWKTEESFEDTRKKETSDKCGYSITSCSTYDCCKRSYTTSSCESSNVILSISRTKEKKRCKENIKFCDHRLENDDNKILLSFRSIKPSLWSYDLLPSTTENIEKQKLNRNNRIRYDKKKKIGNVMNYVRNSHRYDLENSETSITISSQSTKAFLTESDSKYFGHTTYKQQEKTYDNKRIYKQMHNQDHCENEQMRYEYEQCRTRNKYRDVPIKYSNVNSNESFKTSLSHSWRKNARNTHKQLYDISELNKAKRFTCSCSRKNKQIFEKDMSDRSNDSLRSNANLRRRHAFAILTDACNDYMDDLDLDFKLKLLRYVELCKSIKRSLIRTLQPDDTYEISTLSISGRASDFEEKIKYTPTIENSSIHSSGQIDISWQPPERVSTLDCSVCNNASWLPNLKEEFSIYLFLNR
ncbi:hypothetical protein ALC60_10307 [Trachymyrmex zeteki]|uniref:Uncharacterized protein n=1 Tax=Mycetomoellerius zeteki TaxID=64791 RepID=A0A151WRR3_9HYME|nr:hypothetical protein ALC60_10307 [Trachymyrmex zeteki]